MSNGSDDKSETSSNGDIAAEDLLWEPPEKLQADRAPRTSWMVFGTAAGLALSFLLWGALYPEGLGRVSQRALDAVVGYAGWAFILATSGFVLFALWLALSRFGAIRLGRDDEQPEFRTVSWFAMMFAAGMGIGLVFFGASEPVEHFVHPPPGADRGTQADALQNAMATTLFHWTLHPWSIYALVGLAIAYGTFRLGRRQLISAALIPFIGERNAYGPLGRIIDVFALFATLFGTAASLGLGAIQITGGLVELGWADGVDTAHLITVILVLMVGFLLSAVSGVARGIKWLSNTNLVVAVVLLLFLLIVGPTVFMLNLIPTGLGSYTAELFSMGARTEAIGAEEWLSDWTIFYWAWWISWSPFVGMFVARISRGRTIREFVCGVILLPSTVSLLWFSVLGGAALHEEMEQSGVISEAGGEEAQLFALLAQFPLTTTFTVLTMVFLAVFFITSADSTSIIMGTMSQRGSIRPKRYVTVFWGLMIGGVASIIAVVGGESALDDLRNFTIIASAPFAVIIVLMCVAMLRDFRRDPTVVRTAKARELATSAVVSGARTYGGHFQIDISRAEPSGTEEGEEDEEAAADTEEDEGRAGNGRSAGQGRASEDRGRDGGGTERS